MDTGLAQFSPSTNFGLTMKRHLILILEDDHFQADTIANDLKLALPDFDIQICSTELEFREFVDVLTILLRSMA